MLKTTTAPASSHVHVLALVGALDGETARALEAEVVRLCGRGASRIIVDTNALESLDDRGVRAIRLSRRRCANHRCAFAIASGTRRAPGRRGEAS